MRDFLGWRRFKDALRAARDAVVDSENPYCECADGGEPTSFWGTMECARCGSPFLDDLRPS